MIVGQNTIDFIIIRSDYLVDLLVNTQIPEFHINLQANAYLKVL